MGKSFTITPDQASYLANALEVGADDEGTEAPVESQVAAMSLIAELRSWAADDRSAMIVFMPHVTYGISEGFQRA